MSKELQVIAKANLPAILQKFEVGVEILGKEDVQIIVAAHQPFIAACDPHEVQQHLITLITRTYALAGQRIDGETLATYAEVFYDRLLEAYPHLTLHEVAIALKKGVFEEYGEYTALNIKRLSGFVRGYVNSAERKQAFHLFRSVQGMNSTVKLLPGPDAETTSKDLVNTLYSYHIAGELKPWHIPASVFDFLIEKNLIDRILPLERAKILYNEMYEDKPLLLKMKTGPDEKTRQQSIDNLAKKIAVVDFFTWKVENNVQTIFA